MRFDQMGRTNVFNAINNSIELLLRVLTVLSLVCKHASRSIMCALLVERPCHCCEPVRSRMQ